jgi:hypothetical protein
MVSTSPSNGSFLSSFLYSSLAQPISSTQSSLVPTNGKWNHLLVTILSILSEFIDPGFMSVRVSNKASKTIGPPGKPEGNTTQNVLHSLTQDSFNGWL